MRIAHVVPAYPPYRGGMGQVVFEYTERLRLRGHDVHVFTPDYRDVPGDPPYVHRLAARVRFGNAAFVPGVARAVAGFDVVHLHYPFFGGAEPLVLGSASSRRPPIVLSYYMDATAGGIRGVLFDIHRRVLLGRVVAHASRLVVSSRDYAAHSALARVAGALERAEVHPYGVDLERFRPGTEPELRQDLGLGPDSPLVLFVGGLDRAHDFKGVPVLLSAAAMLPDGGAEFVVVGDGSERERYRKLAASLGVRGRVRFAGDVTPAELPRFYRAADVHVLPSTARAEAFGLVTLEAAASGLPSIVSDLPGVRTLVVPGETGLLVPPGRPEELAAAIAELSGSPERRRPMGAAARARAEREYAWPPRLDCLEATYRRAIDGSPPRSTIV